MPLNPRLGYDRWAPTYDDQDPTTTLDEPIVRELCKDVPGRSVLDVGCGTGRYCRLLASLGAHVTGADLSHQMLLRARDEGDGAEGRWVQAASDRLPFADDCFDGVTSGLLLDHVASLEPVFAEFARVVRPGGLLVVTTVHPEVQKIHGPLVRFKAGGSTSRIDAWIHQPEQIFNAAAAAGFAVTEQRELRLEPSAATHQPQWRQHLGRRALLLLAATKG